MHRIVRFLFMTILGKVAGDSMDDAVITKHYEEGFYYLTSDGEPEPILVHGYKCTDLDGEFVFGFNTHDGGNLVKLSDLTDDTTVTPVEILSSNHKSDLEDVIKVQCSNGNWNHDKYMHGLANGLIVAKSIVYGGEPNFLDAPDEWIGDKPDLNTKGQSVADAFEPSADT